MNLIVAQYVASIAVDWKDLRWLLSKSPAHIVLVSYESRSERFDDIIKDAVGTTGPWLWILLGGNGAVLTHRDRMSEGGPTKVAKVGQGQHTFEVAICKTKGGYANPETAVAVGLLSSCPEIAVAVGSPYGDGFS